ncbi:MAG: hypothetical protein K2Q20_03300 [Phycisphaerales bacterium]|nr:hypothetical protein [Phycisphaerales bacterium]
MDPEHPSSADTSLLLSRAADGDRDAADRLLPLVYAQLRKAAQVQMSAERKDHTLSATALVHEAYLKLVGAREVPWSGRAHFYAAAAEAMRRVLLDHAKGRDRLKRGGGGASGGGGDVHIPIGDVADLACRDSDEIVRFEEVFRRFEVESPDGAAVARLRFFAGLSVEQTAEALELSKSTVDRRWAFARAWLYRRLEEERGGGMGNE